MSSTTLIQSPPSDHLEQWRTHLSDAGYEEFHQLHSLLSDDPEAFALFIVRSDFDTETRDALLQQLAQNLAPTQMVTVALTNERLDVPFLLHEAAVTTAQAAFFAITGLEETPHLISAAGEKPTRPPALALLNHGREAIRQVEHPVLLWCDPIAYAALREHAPDFFDHYTALFDFLDAAPLTATANELFDSSLMPNGKPRMVSAISPRPVSPEAVRFYEEQEARFHQRTADRVRALMGLSDALFGLPEENSARHDKRIEVNLREALDIAQELGMRVEAARIQVLISTILNRQRREGQITPPEKRREIVQLIEKSLEVFEESTFPVEWAASQWALGNTYWETAKDENDKRRAISHLQSAQKVWAKEKNPYFWASTEMNLGHVYLDLSPTPGNFKRAISHLEKALEGFKKAEQPHVWALTQMMLGRAYSLTAGLASSDKNTRSRYMRRAIASHKSAAHIFSQIKEPQNAAFALASEGLLWRELPTGNRREHLRQSASCFLEGSALFQQAKDKGQSARPLKTAAQVLMQLGRITNSSKEYEEALHIYQSAQKAFEGASEFVAAQEMQQKAHELREVLQKARAEKKS